MRVAGILRIMDCTLMEIITPSDHEEAYLDYKRNHSLNTQIVSYYIFIMKLILLRNSYPMRIYRKEREIEIEYILKNQKLGKFNLKN